MAKPRFVIQSGSDWIRVTLNGVIVIDNHMVTGRDLQKLFKDMGFPCVLQHGVFGGDDGAQLDAAGDYIFELEKEEP